jgi:hypothetical protein
MGRHSDNSTHDGTAGPAGKAEPTQEPAGFPATVGEAWAWLVLTAGAPWGIYLLPLLLAALFGVDAASDWSLPVAACLSILIGVMTVLTDLRRATHPS